MSASVFHRSSRSTFGKPDGGGWVAPSDSGYGAIGSPPPSERERRNGRSWAQRGILAVNVGLVGACLVLAFLLNYSYQRTASINRVALDRNLTAIPDGVEPGQRVLNVLLVGSDSSAGLDPDDPVQTGREGERFGDVIIVAHVDERSGDVALLSFPRDLWVPIAGTSASDRINRAFVVGGPGSLIDTLEDEFGLPIHHYVNVDFAGFQGLVDAVGAVTVPFESPARDWNVAAKPVPRSQTGFFVGEAGCHALDGQTALAYVRSRYYQTRDESGDWTTDPTSDFGRIRRQQDFLRRLAQAAIDKGARNPFVLNDLLDAALSNVAIDNELTPQLLLDLGLAFRSFNPEDLESFSIPVVDAEIDGNQVLREVKSQSTPILSLFQGATFDDPSTVSVTVVTPERPHAETAEAAESITAALDDAGFSVVNDRRATVANGKRIVHGPNGASSSTQVVMALEQVVTPFDSKPFVVKGGAERLHPRSVEVVINLEDSALAGEQSNPATSATGTASASGNNSNSGNVVAGSGDSPQSEAAGPESSIATPKGPNEPVQSAATVESDESNGQALSC